MTDHRRIACLPRPVNRALERSEARFTGRTLIARRFNAGRLRLKQSPAMQTVVEIARHQNGVRLSGQGEHWSE